MVFKGRAIPFGNGQLVPVSPSQEKRWEGFGVQFECGSDQFILVSTECLIECAVKAEVTFPEYFTGMTERESFSEMLINWHFKTAMTYAATEGLSGVKGRRPVCEFVEQLESTEASVVNGCLRCFAFERKVVEPDAELPTVLRLYELNFDLKDGALSVVQRGEWRSLGWRL